MQRKGTNSINSVGVSKSCLSRCEARSPDRVVRWTMHPKQPSIQAVRPSGTASSLSISPCFAAFALYLFFYCSLTARLGKATPRRANDTYYPGPVLLFAHRAHVPCGPLHLGPAGPRDMHPLTDVYKSPFGNLLLHIHDFDVLN